MTGRFNAAFQRDRQVKKTQFTVFLGKLNTVNAKYTVPWKSFWQAWEIKSLHIHRLASAVIRLVRIFIYIRNQSPPSCRECH